MSSSSSPPAKPPSPAAPRAGRNGARLIEGPVGPLLWSLSWPMTLGLFSVIAFNIVDTFYIGMLGADQLAAISFCFPVIFLMGAIAIGLGAGTVSAVSRAIGAGNMPRARRQTTNALVLGLIYSLILMVVMAFASDPVFALLGAPAALMPMINSYMDVWYAGLIFLLVPIVANNLLRATGAALASSLYMVGAAGVNAVLSPIFIFGWLGFPEMGMAGAAWATIIARGIIAALAIWHLGFKEQVMEVSFRAVQAMPRHIGTILKYALPATVAQMVSPLATALVVRMLSVYGQDAVAGFTVGSRIETLFAIPFFAFQLGMAPFIGQNVGAKKPDRLEQAEGWIWKFSLAWGVLSFIVLTCFGADMGALFTDHDNIIALTDQFLMLTSLGFVFAGVFQVGLGVLNPLGHPNLAAGMSITRYIVCYAGLGFLLSRGIVPGIEGPTGVFLAAPLAWIIAGALSGWLIHDKLPHEKKDMAVSPA